MPFEMLVALDVADDALYQSYREKMTPILESYGGGFGYDFKVAEVLRSATEAPINRVFTIFFADQSSQESFFSDPRYLEVKKNYFERSVAHSTILASYDR